MKKSLESWGTFDPRSEKFLKLHGRVIGRFWDPAKVCELTLRNALDQTLNKLPIFPLFWLSISLAPLLICQLTHQPPQQNCLLYKSGWALPMSGRWIHPFLVSIFVLTRISETDSGNIREQSTVKMGPCRDSPCIESCYIQTFSRPLIDTSHKSRVYLLRMWGLLRLHLGLSIYIYIICSDQHQNRLTIPSVPSPIKYSNIKDSEYSDLYD